MVARAQYLIGLFVYLFAGPFINIAVLAYALWNLDSFGWGKTRVVIAEVDDDVAPSGSDEQGATLGEDNEKKVAIKRDDENRAFNERDDEESMVGMRRRSGSHT